MKNVSDMPALIPELLVRDIAASLSFYVDVLGFTVEYDRPENRFAMISVADAWMMLEQSDGCVAVTDRQFVEDREWRTGTLEYPFGRGINFQIVVEDIDDRYRSVLERGYPIRVPMEERWYRAGKQLIGVRQFLLQDPDGYLLRIQQNNGVKPLPDA